MAVASPLGMMVSKPEGCRLEVTATGLDARAVENVRNRRSPTTSAFRSFAALSQAARDGALWSHSVGSRLGSDLSSAILAVRSFPWTDARRRPSWGRSCNSSDVDESGSRRSRSSSSMTLSSAGSDGIVTSSSLSCR